MSGELENNQEIDAALKEFEAQKARGELANDSEINSALKAFEAKAGSEQIPQSPVVTTFDEPPRMVKWVFKLSGGAITEQKQAEYVLFGLVVVVVGISLFLVFGGNFSSHKILELTPEQRSFMETGRGFNQ